MKRAFIAIAALVLFAACLGGGAKHFRAGNSAYDKGDLQAADDAYTKALAENPNNAEYKAAQQKVRRELAKEHVAEATAKEKSGAFAEASAAWAKAAELVPDESDYPVRRDLSGAKAKNLGPDEWFEAVKKVAAENEDNDIAKRSFAGARAAAYKHHLDLAEGFLAGGEGGRAFEHYSRAKEIDPTTPGMRADAFVRAQALSIAEQAEEKMRGGDAIGAYELYQSAYAKMPLPEIKSEMDRVKRKASAILSKLENARRAAEKGQFQRALNLYERVTRDGRVPDSINDEIKQVRAELLKSKANDARRFADRNNLSRAYRALNDAVRVAGLDQVGADVFIAAIDLVKDGDPGKGREAIDKSGIEEGSPLFEAAQAYALAGARKVLKQAERTARRDKPKALRMVADLGAFEEEVPGIAALRRKLRAGSFNALLDEALREAKRRNDREAASLLLAALNASAAPDSMRNPATKGADELKLANYAAAEKAFTEALAAAPRSRLAQRGIDIARLRRKDAEKQAADTLVSGKGNEARAVETLAAGLALEPGNTNARKAYEGIVRRLEKGASLTDAEVADLVTYANKLAALKDEAKSAIDDGASSMREGDLGGAEEAFGKALAAVPSARLAEVGQKVAKQRMLNSLTSDAAGAVKGDEASAESLAELLKRDPNNKQAKAALAKLIDTAKDFAKQNNDGEASRYLNLATIATSPAPGVKAALDEGTAALAQGKMVEAESKFSDALDLEPAQPVAKAGFEIAKAARVAMLSGAIAQAKQGGNLEAAREALERTLKANPNSPEARKAFGELLDEAERQAAAGDDAKAAGLLSTANVVSKPETAKKKIAAANDQLAKKDYDAAIAAYDEVLKTGDSKLAARGKKIAEKRRIVTLEEVVAGLKVGTDEKRGAEAAAKLRKIDPASETVKAAVESALARAQTSASSGNDAAAAATLSAVAVAVGEEKSTKKAISLLSSGKYGEAEVMFSKAKETDLTRRGLAIARGRKLGTLSKDLGRGGSEAALAIKALLAADPNNAEAKKAFNGFLARAKAEAKKGNDKAAGTELSNANVAAGAPDDLTNTVKTGIDHFSESRYAEAEQAFTSALEIAKASAVAKTGHEMARDSRRRQEREAMSAIAKTGDPRPHAKVLGASLIVEPKSNVVSKAFQGLLRRAEKSAKRGADVETAQELEAAALLENKGMDTVKQVTEASALYAKASFVDAQQKFSSIVEGQNGDGSKVARLGAELALARRIALLEDKFNQAKKDKDVLAQADAAAAILKLDPNHREAKRAAGSLEKQVKSSRLDTAKTHEEQGKLGVAYVYLERALALDENDKDAKTRMDGIKEKLKKRLDLILVVDPVMRSKKVRATDCKGFDTVLREEAMKGTSRRTDLGAYVLSPSWTEAWKKKSPKAPEVSGSIKMTLESCRITPGTGKAKVGWEVLVPHGEATAVKGTFETKLPAGSIPVDEQDGQGKNARVAFAKHVSSKLGDGIETSRDATDLWMLTLAEHAMSKNDAVLAADAYARIRIKAPINIDPDRMKKVEAFLTEKFR